MVFQYLGPNAQPREFMLSGGGKMNSRILRTLQIMMIFSSVLICSVDAYVTENVFIVSVDGIRDLEAFSYEFQPGDSIHPYMPFIWDILKPQGIAFMEMYNVFKTTTTPGHSTILTGDWEIIPAHEKANQYWQSRSWAPTVFEYYRKEKGTWQTGGRDMVRGGEE
jgi:hypothetical protein